MSSRQAPEAEPSPSQWVESGSYTALRLQHATPEHIHLTTRRCFIGPIPKGWLKSHRKSWYKRYINLTNYSSRAATFSAGPHVSHQRQITGLDGPSATAVHGQSFRQPADLDGADDRDEGRNGEEEAEAEAMSGIGSLPDRGSYSQAKFKTRPNMKQRMASIRSGQSYSASSYVTAPSRPRQNFKQGMGSIYTAQNPAAPSFVTASSYVTAPESMEPTTPSPPNEIKPNQLSYTSSSSTQPTPVIDRPGEALTSKTSLIDHEGDAGGAPFSSDIPATDSSIKPQNEDPRNPAISTELPDSDTIQPGNLDPISSGLIRFNIPNQVIPSITRTNAKLLKTDRYRLWSQFQRGQSHPGVIVKVEKMLIRIDSTAGDMDDDYNENDSLRTETRTVENWREFIVVCRESTNGKGTFSIQMYKSRVIPAVEQPRVRKRPTHTVPLIRKTTHVNLYSSLDKTLAIWVPWKVGKRIYILRTRSAASSMEWYTFFRNSLGLTRASTLKVHIPDLSVTLHVENPFGQLEALRDTARAQAGDDATIVKITEAERAISGIIIQRCMKMLEDSPEWANVLEAWLKNEKMGLAWKRYDRLEWLHGANEQRMYGTLAMQNSHELELRPKQHYPTSIKAKTESTMDEPAPVEGFLIRLTSQRGRVQRFGKMFFKRLYFSTHNQFLCYCRPARASPPPPPQMPLSEHAKIPTASEIVDKTPLIYAVNPYSTKQGGIAWLSHGNTATRRKHDQDAYKEAERKVNSMLRAEGYINLSHVIRVQDAYKGDIPVDASIQRGPDVDFHAEVRDTARDDGATKKFDDKRTLELILKNGLRIRLQAYNEVTKKEWITRLTALAQYWKLRLADDVHTLKAVRQANLTTLNIDEKAESFLGQFAEKWEVTRSVASPQLFNMCGISCCRAITMSGVLYRKPKRHTTFMRCGVILCHGQLMIFQGTLRERTGKEVPHIQHDRQAAIELKDCYIYSGLVTEADLLYQNQTFDSNHPGHHALPRIYREDGWTSTDEDTMTCFVVWQPRNKSFFKALEERAGGKTRQRLRYVSRLGVPGRSIVFKARSRAERDHWVMNIGMEIERLQQGEEVRVVQEK